jgi:hypothetical protein
MSLGVCSHCSGPLAFARQQLVCERCGRPQHAPSAEAVASLDRPDEKPNVVRPADQRVPNVEQRLTAIEQRLTAIERRLSALEGDPEAATAALAGR